MSEMPFEIIAAVILPEHLHFIWALPEGDQHYSARIGRLKILFTRTLRAQGNLPQTVSESRRKHRESDVWQRRFWEHQIKNDDDFETHLNYIHYNPVKHNLVSCPHFWLYSSFSRWVNLGAYSHDWCCCCPGKKTPIPNFEKIINLVGE